MPERIQWGEMIAEAQLKADPTWRPENRDDLPLIQDGAFTEDQAQ